MGRAHGVRIGKTGTVDADFAAAPRPYFNLCEACVQEPGGVIFDVVDGSGGVAIRSSAVNDAAYHGGESSGSFALNPDGDFTGGVVVNYGLAVIEYQGTSAAATFTATPRMAANSDIDFGTFDDDVDDGAALTSVFSIDVDSSLFESYSVNVVIGVNTTGVSDSNRVCWIGGFNVTKGVLIPGVPARGNRDSRSR